MSKKRHSIMFVMFLCVFHWCHFVGRTAPLDFVWMVKATTSQWYMATVCSGSRDRWNYLQFGIANVELNFSKSDLVYDDLRTIILSPCHVSSCSFAFLRGLKTAVCVCACVRVVNRLCVSVDLMTRLLYSCMWVSLIVLFAVNSQ